MEIYEEEDKPEIIDLDEDLSALDEIEQIEKVEEEKVEPYASVSGESHQNSPSYNEDIPDISDDSQAENLQEEDETVSYNEPKKDIFSNIDHFKTADLDEFTKLAHLNAGSTLVYCHMAIKKSLKKRLQRYQNQVPTNFEQIIRKLKEYEPVEYESHLLDLNNAREKFSSDMRSPRGDILKFALDYLSQE